MSRKDRIHLVSDVQGDDTSTPRFLTKEEFGRRLYRMMIARGWRQADLARAADLPRDSISTYIRGKTYPTPLSAQKLAGALGITAHQLLPNLSHNAVMEDRPSFEMKVSPADPAKAWIKIDRQTSFSTATKIAALLEEDDAADRN